MGVREKISGFQGEYRFLSNFYIEPDGTHVEGEYQASKCVLPVEATWFRGLPPGACKRVGRKVRIRPDWDTVKIEIMYQLVRRKFLDHQELADKLRMTASAYLEEENHWGDTFWGVCRGKGQNHLGRILMVVRKEILTVQASGGYQSSAVTLSPSRK